MTIVLFHLAAVEFVMETHDLIDVHQNYFWKNEKKNVVEACV